ncbi:PGF-CTERM sorting domain-containing protein [Halomicrococcus gelatinilyticus]|uniref:PGF-CTERM sorting domain-containing protein n=1 Tax=Halomicrococcus gelatinilyticus TaxID=1702103 RepID=UPI002E0E0698
MSAASRRRAFAVVAAVLCSLSLLAAPMAAGESGNDQPTTCVGTMEQPANGTTVVAVQGFTWHDGATKKPAKLVGLGPRGQVKWVHHSAEHGVSWQYDVDPMDNGNVFVTATSDGKTKVYEFDPRTQKHVWEETLHIEDTHDVDLINDGTQLLVANMKNYDEKTETNNDSIFVYDLQKDEIVWRWFFRDHYDESVGGNYTRDWTHVNDVDKIGDGRYLASPRNFDQAIVVDRETDEITMQLGEDGNHSVLYEQHNPDFLRNDNLTATMLVADSENRRIVEYERGGDGWAKTWQLGTGDDLKWPRDADRLPNGNTLVSDSRNHRVVEVTPTGEVVWEVYAPFLVYDAARLKTGEHAGGPTIADLNATGTYSLEGDAALYENWSNLERCHADLQQIDGWAPGQEPTTTTSTGTGGTGESGVNDDSDGNDGVLGTTTTPDGQPGFGAGVALAALLVTVALLARRRA